MAAPCAKSTKTNDRELTFVDRHQNTARHRWHSLPRQISGEQFTRVAAQKQGIQVQRVFGLDHLKAYIHEAFQNHIPEMGA